MNAQRPAPLSAAAALAEAEADARRAYGDLSGYSVLLRLEIDGWHVEYELAAALQQGGGPHYLIDPASGAIVSKTYYQ